jgi:hypothetical protein
VDAACNGVYGRKWFRIVLDEGHVIRNGKTKISIACCAVEATNRWIVTGTPMNNSLTELHALVGKFLQCGPFADRTVWRQQIDNDTELGREKLSALLGTLMLRRTKVMHSHPATYQRSKYPTTLSTCVQHNACCSYRTYGGRCTYLSVSLVGSD